MSSADTDNGNECAVSMMSSAIRYRLFVWADAGPTTFFEWLRPTRASCWRWEGRCRVAWRSGAMPSPPPLLWHLFHGLCDVWGVCGCGQRDALGTTALRRRVIVGARGALISSVLLNPSSTYISAVAATLKFAVYGVFLSIEAQNFMSVLTKMPPTLETSHVDYLTELSLCILLGVFQYFIPLAPLLETLATLKHTSFPKLESSLV